MTAKAYNAGVLGTGFYLPEKILTNADLEKIVDTSDEWITERTGIKERRIADDGVPMSHLAIKAAEMALEDAGVKPEELDLIIVATLTSDRIIPSTACILQDRLGATHAAAFDLSAACSGFVYAATVAAQFITNGAYKKALVIGAETLSKYIECIKKDEDDVYVCQEHCISKENWEMYKKIIGHDTELSEVQDALIELSKIITEA